MLYGIQHLAALFSPAVFLAVSLALVALVVWAGGHVRRSMRVLHALSHAPLADTRSTTPGLVKLMGAAKPPPPPPGQSEAPIVWSESQRSSSTGGFRTGSGTISVGFIRIADEHGACAVDVQRARMVGTTSTSEHSGLQPRVRSSSAQIARDDPVFALGELHQGAPRGLDPSSARCTLHPNGGVLLVSGAPERQVRALYGLYMPLQVAGAAFGLFLLATTVRGHLQSYPPGGMASARTFATALSRTPFRWEPGLAFPVPSTQPATGIDWSALDSADVEPPVPDTPDVDPP